MRRLWRWGTGLVALGLSAVCSAQATNAEGSMQPFAMRWDDIEPTVVDLSFLSPDEAGARGPVRIGDDGHLYTGDERLRLFGNNIGGGTVFADGLADEQRNAFAGRMRKFGYNAIRFHHLEAMWLGRNVFGPVSNGRNESTKQIDPESLDRLQRWFAAFKRHGIYTNMNLLVSRRFVAADGVPELDGVPWKLQGTIAMWHPQMIELQKDYARQLLASDNPHTGMPIARDPSLATVEINNENGILHAWFDGELDKVPPSLIEPLRVAWNQWLEKRYGSTEALATAWRVREVPLGEPLIDGPAAFQLERHGGAEAQISTTGGETIIRIDRAGSAGWHVQWGRPGIAFQADEPYTLRFEARADSPRSIVVNISQAHDPWANLGFAQTIELAREWKTFEYTVLLPRGDHNGRLIFSGLSRDGATFGFRNISLRPGGRVGGAAPLGEVALPIGKNAQAQTTRQRRDFIAFCMDAERAYFGQMRRFVREELGVTAPVVGTIVGCSPMGVQKEMDAIDTHAYWRHPVFPGRPWDPQNWTIAPDSMVNYPRSAAILPTMLKQVRVDGRRLPHMLTEYDHPAPNPYAAEGPLFLATYAALQDYDAVYFFAYDRTPKDPAGKILGFFDTMNHPTVVANTLAAALIFRRGLISPAREEAVVTITEEQELDALAERGRAWRMANFGDFTDQPLAAYTRRVAVNFAAQPAPAPKVEQEPGKLHADNGQIAWTVPADQQEGGDGGSIVFGNGTDVIGAMGHGRGLAVAVRNDSLTLVDLAAGPQCRTAVLVRLEGDPLNAPGRTRALLIITGDAANTNWQWKDEKKQMLTSWGGEPTVIETVPATLTIPNASTLRVWALDPAGRRAEEARVERADKGPTARLGPGHTQTATLWYEIEWE